MSERWWPAGTGVFGSSQTFTEACEVGSVCDRTATAMYLLTPTHAHSAVPPRVACFECAFALTKKDGACLDCGAKFAPALDGFRVQGVR